MMGDLFAGDCQELSTAVWLDDALREGVTKEAVVNQLIAVSPSPPVHPVIGTHLVLIHELQQAAPDGRIVASGSCNGGV